MGSSKWILHFAKNCDAINHVLFQLENKKDRDILDFSVVDIDSIIYTEVIPDLLNIDVEGFETKVVSRMSESIWSVGLKAIIIELNGSDGSYGFDDELIYCELLEYIFYLFNIFLLK